MRNDKPIYIPKNCIQCGRHAEVHAMWVARKSGMENVPQQAVFCNDCMKKAWDLGKNTQFGQTLQLRPLI